MQKIVILLFLCFVRLITTAQTSTFYNNGSVLQINGNATIQINGDLTNEVGSNLVNNGSINLLGNLVNNQVMPSANTGSIYFSGLASQTLSGSASFLAYDAYINNAQGLVLNNTLQIANSFYFTNGIVTASNTAYPLLFTATANAIAASNSSHVIGYTVKQGVGSFTYPVGNALYYQPITTSLATNSAGMQVNYNPADAGAGSFTTTGTEATPLIAYNALEYWNTVPIGTATGIVTVYWDGINNVGITNVADLKVAHKLSGNWLNEGTTGTGSIALGNVSSNTLGTWGIFTLGSIKGTSPLPVILGTFDVSKVNNTGLITWNTIAELNSKNFEVQHSADGINFITIGTVAAKGYASDYSLVDYQPYTGINYYRLKENDDNGQYTYSAIKTLYFDPLGIYVQVYPNPATNILNVRATNARSITIYDAEGKKVFTTATISANGTTAIRVSNLIEATYVVEVITTRGDRVVQKFVKN